MWAGTDACEPVTWQECKLVPKEVKFIVPEMTCQEKQELWYHEPEQVEGIGIDIGAICLSTSTIVTCHLSKHQILKTSQELRNCPIKCLNCRKCL